MSHGKATARFPPRHFIDQLSKEIPLRYFVKEEFHIVIIETRFIHNTNAAEVSVATKCGRKVTYNQHVIQMPQDWAMKVGYPCVTCFAGIPKETR